MSVDDHDIGKRLHRLLSDVHPGDEVWGSLVGRRRRRRIRRGALATLPVVMLAVFAVGLWSQIADGDRADVAAGPSGDETDGWVDFHPFEMTYRTTQTQPAGSDATMWRLEYRSADAWTVELLEPGDQGPTVGREELADGVHTTYKPDGSVLDTEPVDGRKVPLSILARGRWGGERRWHTADIERLTSDVECLEDGELVNRTCLPEDTVMTVDLRTTYNEDGVPVLVEETVRDTGELRWRFEVLTYRRAGDAEPMPAPPAEGSWEPDGFHVNSWEGVATSADGRTLIVAFVAGKPYDPSNPCTEDYRGVVQESSDRVLLRVEKRSPPPPPTDEPWLCTDEGYTRILEVTLDAPLGDRLLVELPFDRVRPVFDGARLVEPTWLPDGWEHQGGWPGLHPFGGRGDSLGWTRTWDDPYPGSIGDRCTATEEGITLTQTSREQMEASPPYGLDATSTHDVNGASATYWTGGPYDLQSLTWVVGDEGFVLSPAGGCADDVPLTFERLLRFARGLETPTR